MRGQRTRLPGRRQSRKRELYKKLNVDRNLAYPSERTSLSKQPTVRSQTNTLFHFILFIGITEPPFQKKKKYIYMGPVPGAGGALDDQKRQGCVSRWMKVGVARDSSLGAKCPAIGAGSRWMTRQAGAFLRARYPFPSSSPSPSQSFPLSPLPSPPSPCPPRAKSTPN